MPVPFVLSPYLRPIRTPDAPGAFLLDDGVTGRIELDPPMQAIVRALWRAEGAEAALAAAAARFGPAELNAAVDRLRERRVLHEDAAACEASLAASLAAGVPADVPFVDQIELTNVCPFKCAFCPRGVPGKMKRPMGKMDPALFERILDQLHPEQPRWRAIELHHLGESLVHPDLARFIGLMTKRGLSTELSCNPSMLKGDLGPRILDAGIRRLVVSIDGVDDATSMAIRGPVARYDRSVQNLETLLAHASQMADPPTIVVQMIDLERNRHQHRAFVARWGNTGLPFVHAYVKDLDGPDPDTGRSSATPVSYLCTYPWRSVVILWDGRVVPCCRDADADLVLGDLNVQSLAEIWAGEPVRKLREALSSCAVPSGHLCDGCEWRRETFAAAMPRRHPDAAKEEPLHW